MNKGAWIWLEYWDMYNGAWIWLECWDMSKGVRIKWFFLGGGIPDYFLDIESIIFKVFDSVNIAENLNFKKMTKKKKMCLKYLNFLIFKTRHGACLCLHVLWLNYQLSIIIDSFLGYFNEIFLFFFFVHAF